MRTTTVRYGEQAPEGYHWVAEPDHDPNWLLWTGGQCRAGASRYRRACGRPAVAALLRPNGHGGTTPWVYCEDHLYGRWIEDGQLYIWRLRKIGEDDQT